MSIDKKNVERVEKPGDCHKGDSTIVNHRHKAESLAESGGEV
jgi:hypothetical protein